MLNQKLTRTEAYQEYNIITNVTDINYHNQIIDCDKNVAFFDGGLSQWESSEITAMATRGQYTLTLNATRKATIGMVGLFTSSKPKFRCDPVGSSDNAIAGIANELIDHSYRVSKGSGVITEILLNAFKANMSYAVVRAIGNDKVIFEAASYRDIIFANGKRMMLEDAEWCAVKKLIPLERVEVLYGIKPTVCSYPREWIAFDGTYQQQGSKLELFDQARKYLLVFERYIKFFEKTEDGQIRKRIKVRTLLGYDYVYEQVLPPEITEIPIIPMYSDISNNQYKFGEVHFLRDPQRFMNKMINEVMRSAQAMSSGKVIVRKNDIAGGDADAFAANWSLPGAVVVLNPAAQKPEIVYPAPLNGAYFDMFQNASAMFGTLNLSGDAQKFNDLATDPARKQEWDQMITASLRIPATIFEAFLSQLGKVILQFQKAYISNDNLVHILNADDALKIVESAQKDRLDASTMAGITMWSNEKEKSGMSLEEIDETIYKTKEALAKLDALYDFINDPKVLDVDVQIEADSYTSTNATNRFKMMYQLAEKGLVPPEILVEYLPVDDKEAIKVKISRMRSAARQVDQLNKQLETMTRDNEKMSQENRTLKDKIIDTRREAGHDYQTKDSMLKKLADKKNTNFKNALMTAENRLALKELALEIKDMARENPEEVAEYINNYIGE
jgi:hypothetical protein